MHANLRKSLLALAAATGLALSTAVFAHFDEDEVPQSYRQSWFALAASNFGPMVASVKGEIPWDQGRMERWAGDLATLTTLDILRGFTPGSEQGKTRAKPEIWENRPDFEAKLRDLITEIETLESAVKDGNREEIAARVGATGDACKACHDEYKSKEYLY